MKNIFDLEIQNNSVDGKIVAGLERLSQVFKVLLWEKAKKHDLTPIQIQILIFIKHHSAAKTTVSYLSKEFNLTKATVSDTIKILERKEYISKIENEKDSRSYSMELTMKGLEMVLLTEDFTDPLFDLVAQRSENDKTILWKNMTSIIEQLHNLKVINVQSTCYNCGYFVQRDGKKHCQLMDIPLKTNDIRLDCPDHKAVRL